MNVSEGLRACRAAVLAISVWHDEDTRALAQSYGASALLRLNRCSTKLALVLLRGESGPIPADELQVMRGPHQAFCSWDASPSKVSGQMARWPFLFSRRQERKQHPA